MLTLTQAAARLGLARSTLRRQAKKGSLRAVKFGRDWAVSEAEVERYRIEHLNQPGRKPKEKEQGK